MYIKIINQWHNDSIEDFQFKVDKQSYLLEEKNHIVVDIQILLQNNSLIAIIKYK
jgi:hypothetical protein